MRFPILLSCLLLSPMLLAQHPTETEPNDTVAQANTITPGTQLEAILIAGETDWFKFTLPAAQRARLDTSGVDTRFTLFDATGVVPLGHDDDSRLAVNAWGSNLWLNLTAGSYTLKIVGFSPTDAGPYTIDFATFATKIYTATEFEPNDTYLTANLIALPLGGAQVHGNIGPSTTMFSGSTPATTIALSNLVPATAIVISKSVSTSTTTVITPVGGGMTASAYIPGFSVIMTSGVNLGLIRAISSNTATTITTAAWPVANAAADTFDIITSNSTTVTRASTPLTASAYISGHALRMTSGANIGLLRAITANSTTTITTAAWPVANSPGDTFDVITASSTTVIQSTAALTASAYIGGLYQIRFTSGSNLGQARQITANTATTITCAAFVNVPGGGDAFVIELVDTDFYRITLTAPRTGVWFLVNEGDAPVVHGHRYEVYDASGVLVLASSTTAPAFGVNAANAGAGTSRTSQIRVWPAGTYHIAIRSPSASYAAPNDVLPFGNYCLEIFADMTIGTGATIAENAEPNDTVANATPLTFGQRGTGNISITTGADSRDVWGPFTVPNYPCVVTFQSGRGTPTPIADTTVNLLTSTGAVAVAATTGNLLDWTSHGRTTVQFTGGGTYYVEVVSGGTTTTTQQGDYVMEISNVMAVPYQTASYVTVAANATCGVAPFPTLGVATMGELPTLGALFSRNVTDCGASGIGFLIQGLTNATANGGSTPLPYSLAPMGAPGCTIDVDPLVSVVFVANGAGTAVLDAAYPPNIAMRGLTIFEQAVILNSGANTLGLQVSNYARLIGGERSF